MTAGRIRDARAKHLPRRSSNPLDHVSYSPTDMNAAAVLPPEYPELARRSILANAGADAAEFLAMLGLDEVPA